MAFCASKTEKSLGRGDFKVYTMPADKEEKDVHSGLKK